MVFKELTLHEKKSHAALEQWSACINGTLNVTFSERCSEIMLSKINNHAACPLTLKSTLSYLTVFCLCHLTRMQTLKEQA